MKLSEIEINPIWNQETKTYETILDLELEEGLTRK